MSSRLGLAMHHFSDQGHILAWVCCAGCMPTLAQVANLMAENMLLREKLGLKSTEQVRDAQHLASWSLISLLGVGDLGWACLRYSRSCSRTSSRSLRRSRDAGRGLTPNVGTLVMSCGSFEVLLS